MRYVVKMRYEDDLMVDAPDEDTAKVQAEACALEDECVPRAFFVRPATRTEIEDGCADRPWMSFYEMLAFGLVRSNCNDDPEFDLASAWAALDSMDGDELRTLLHAVGE